MEFANDTLMALLSRQVRQATPDDARAIMQLLQSGDCVHGHVGWRLPGEWIGSPGFVVIPHEQEAQSTRQMLFGQRERVRACLAVGLEAPLAAWVQVTAVANSNETKEAIEVMLAAVEAYLRTTAVAQLGWLAIEEWPNDILPHLGFKIVNEIRSYLKPNLTAPMQRDIPELIIRSARLADMEALAKVEQVAFEPLWRYGTETLMLAHRQALSFDVAEWQGKLVGYQLSTSATASAHLVRLTIDPAMQGKGVGTALLTQAVESYRQYGASQVTLNTQIDNSVSQGLYQKFGFQPLEERFPVWMKQL